MPRSCPQLLTRRPSTATVPALAVSRPMTMRNSVVLPQPLGPMIAPPSPSWTTKPTPPSASTDCTRPSILRLKRLEIPSSLTSPKRPSSFSGRAGRRLGPSPSEDLERLQPQAGINHAGNLDGLGHVAGFHQQILPPGDFLHPARPPPTHPAPAHD